VFVWGFGVLFLSCVCVGVGGGVLCRCVCVCVLWDLLILLHEWCAFFVSAGTRSILGRASTLSRPTSATG